MDIMTLIHLTFATHCTIYGHDDVDYFYDIYLLYDICMMTAIIFTLATHWTIYGHDDLNNFFI